jgi:geranylgeranyl diphosphate synthase type II
MDRSVVTRTSTARIGRVDGGAPARAGATAVVVDTRGRAASTRRPAPPPARGQRLPRTEWIDAVERRLDALLPTAGAGPAPLPAAMRDAVLAPGKRLRPLLAMAATLELGADPADAIDAGCALEMVHAASLALDDLPCMDDARLRRGRPALHVAHGEDLAILASVALLSRAFGVLAALPGLDASVRASLGATLADCVGHDGLAGGQVEDLRGAARRRDARDARRCNLRKTGAAFAAAVDIGAAIARTPARGRGRLRAFALHLGCAFQIRDDLIDVTATAAQAGKDTGRDAARRTVVGVLGADSARRELRAHLLAARRAAVGARGGPAAADGPLAQFLQAAFDAELRALPA